MHVIKRRPNASQHREKATKILVFARLAVEKDFPPKLKTDQQKRQVCKNIVTKAVAYAVGYLDHDSP